MLDFTSALYLGLRHPSSSLRPWTELTMGRPAALALPPGASAVAQKLALLQGCESAILAPSTLHLFWDLFGTLGKDGVAIYMDSGTYPIARWGIERAIAQGTIVRSFPHHDPRSLDQWLNRDMAKQGRPVVITDGFCPGCGKAAPLPAYLESVRKFGGLLLLDDTQALGILGKTPSLAAPYGLGGGGSLRWHNISGPDVLVVSSLAKGFGVPIAVLSGSENMIRRFEEKSETRVHCSPPSVAVIHATEQALIINQVHGDVLRGHLVRLVRHLRTQLSEAGFSTIGWLFPVQTLAPIPGMNAATLYRRLLQRGIRAVLRRGHSEGSPCLSFLITTRHWPSQIDRAVEALEHAASTKTA